MTAFANVILGVVDLEAHLLMVITCFWTAAVVVVTLPRSSAAKLFWLLAIDGGLLLYQATLLKAGLEGVPLHILAGPALLATLMSLASEPGGLRNERGLTSVWVIASLPGFAAALLSPLLDPVRSVGLFGIAILYPVVVFRLASRIAMVEKPERLEKALVLGFLVATAVSLVLIPVELSQRGITSVAALQYGGRAYSLIGVLFLLWPILLSVAGQWSKLPRLLAFSLIVLLVGSSFSRGAVAIFAILLVVTAAGRWQGSGRIARRIAAGTVAAGSLAVWLLPQAFGGAGRFWLLRLNLTSNYGSTGTSALQGFLLTSRPDIWSLALTLFFASPLYGHGLGSSPTLLEAETGGLYAFSGMHQLVLTVLVERGLVGLVGVTYLVWRIWKALRRSTLGFVGVAGFVGFLAFSFGTGVELFLNASRVVNASVTLYLFLMLLYLEQVSAPLKASPQ